MKKVLIILGFLILAIVVFPKPYQYPGYPKPEAVRTPKLIPHCIGYRYTTKASRDVPDGTQKRLCFGWVITTEQIEY